MISHSKENIIDKIKIARFTHTHTHTHTHMHSSRDTHKHPHKYTDTHLISAFLFDDDSMAPTVEDKASCEGE